MLNPTPRPKMIKVGARAGPDGEVTIFSWFQIAYHAKIVITGTSNSWLLSWSSDSNSIHAAKFGNPTTDQNK